jgi:hypothetical protein
MTACPVKGCRATQPHASDPIVQALMLLPPEEVIALVRDALEEVRTSLQDDISDGRTFAWFTRMRYVEELYMRCVYVVLLAPDEEIPHIFSGDTPNGFDFIYEQFNRKVLDGKGVVSETKPGLTFGNVTPMKTVHNAAHGSFQTLLTWRASKVFPQGLGDLSQRYIQHIETYRRYLQHSGQLFAAGRDKGVIVQALRNMHSPLPVPPVQNKQQ